MKTYFATGIIVLTTLLLLSRLPYTLADMGGISLTPWVPIYEPGQKAIVAWNGQEEILIISTDVNADESTLVIRMLPLPSNPKTVEKANFTSFTTLQALLQKHAPTYVPSNAWSLAESAQDALATVVITFHEKIGTHDITIVKSNNASELTRWIDNFLEENGISERISLHEFEDVIEDYMSRRFIFFVLDLIDVSSQQQSVEPILYWFETSFLYYPLRISSLFSGNTEITLFLLTKEEIGGVAYPFSVGPWWPPYTVVIPPRYNQSLESYVGIPIQFNLTNDELEQVDLRIKSLFDNTALLTPLTYRGPLGLFIGDLILKHGETLIGYPLMPSPLMVMLANLTMIQELNLVTIPIDYGPPTINLVSHSIVIDEAIESAVVQCHVEDNMSGIRDVTLFYQVDDGEWNSVEMKNVEEKFTATIPLQNSEKANFYIEAFDKAGNKEVDDNNGVYYLIDVAAYTRAHILHSLGIVALCTLTASAIALTTKTYVRKRFQES